MSFQPPEMYNNFKNVAWEGEFINPVHILFSRLYGVLWT